MRKLFSNVGRKLFRNESGAALLEYSVLLGVILVVAIGSMIFAGEWVSQRWADLQGQLETVPADGTTTGGTTTGGTTTGGTTTGGTTTGG